jgi:hypothetical protein
MTHAPWHSPEKPKPLNNPHDRGAENVDVHRLYLLPGTGFASPSLRFVKEAEMYGDGLTFFKFLFLGAATALLIVAVPFVYAKLKTPGGRPMLAIALIVGGWHVSQAYGLF